MPLEEELNLDVSAALDAIDNLENSLAAAVSSFSDGLVLAINDAAVAPLEVNTDTAAVTADLDSAVGAADSNLEIQVDAPPITSEIEGAIHDVDAVVSPEVDTSAVDDLATSLGDVQDQAAGGAEEMGLFGDATEKAGTATELATQGSDGLIASLGALSGSSIKSVAILATLAVATHEFFHAGSEAETQTKRFNTVLGEQAEAFERVKINGVADGLKEIGVIGGTTEARMKDVTATIFQLGSSSGRSGSELFALSSKFFALAERTAVLRPDLGSVGDIAESMTTKLAKAKGQVSLLGTSFTSAQITAEALRESGKKTSDELTTFDKSAAAATLATRQLGGSLKTDVNGALDTAANKSRSFKVELDNIRDDASKQILQPFVDILHEAQPILIKVTTAVIDLGGAILPVVAGGLHFADMILSNRVALVILAGLIGSQVVPALAAMTVNLGKAIVSGFLDFVTSMIGPLLGMDGAVTGLAASELELAAAEGTAAAGGFTLSAALGPIGLIAGLVGGAIAIFGHHAHQAAKDTADFTDALKQNGRAQEEAFNKTIADTLAKNGFTKALHDLGLSTKEQTLLTQQAKDAILGSSDAYDKHVKKLYDTTDGLGQVTTATGYAIVLSDKQAHAFDTLNKVVGDNADKLKDQKTKLDDTAAAMDALGAKTEVPTTALEDYTTKIYANKDAFDKDTSALQRFYDTLNLNINKQLDLSEAQIQTAEGLASLEAALKESKNQLDSNADANTKAGKAQLDSAKALDTQIRNVEAEALAQANANGIKKDTPAAVQVEIDALAKLATHLKGPAKLAIQAHINELQHEHDIIASAESYDQAVANKKKWNADLLKVDGQRIQANIAFWENIEATDTDKQHKEVAKAQIYADNLALKIQAGVKDIPGTLRNAFHIAPDDPRPIAEQFLNGLTNALLGSAAKKNLDSAIHGVADSFKGLGHLLGIHSPSTVAMEMGEFFVQGLAQGLSDTRIVDRAVLDLSKSTQAFRLPAPSLALSGTPAQRLSPGLNAQPGSIASSSGPTNGTTIKIDINAPGATPATVEALRAVARDELGTALSAIVRKTSAGAGSR